MVREDFLVVFDLRDPEAVRRCYDERAAQRERADVEILDQDHAALIVVPGVSLQERRAA
jgi:hypothetical protein